MSTAAVGWALDSRRTGPLDPATRLVLVVLADHAHADGTSAFPSKVTISDRIDVSPRTVQRHLGALVDLGLIRPGDAALVSHIRSDRRPNVWDLALDTRGDKMTPRDGRGDDTGPTGSHRTSPRGVTPDSQTKNRTNNENSPHTPLDGEETDDADPSIVMAQEHALADHLPMRSPRAPENGECNGCAEVKLLVADGLCRRCLMAEASA